MEYMISQISEIILSCMINRHNIVAQELYNMTNDRIGFIFDYRVCDVPDFYQFLIYYCHQIINLQFINSTFVAFPKHMGYTPYPSCINNQYINNQGMYCQSHQIYSNRPQYYADYQCHYTCAINPNLYGNLYGCNHTETKPFNYQAGLNNHIPHYNNSNSCIINNQLLSCPFQYSPSLYNPLQLKNFQK